VRVLHLTTEFPPIIYGGLGTAVGGWVNASARGGIDVAVQLVEGPLALSAASYGALRSFVMSRSGVSHHEGITFFQCSWSAAVEMGIRLVREWRADIVHLHTAMLWYVAQGIQAETRTPIVYHIHSVDRAEYEIGEEPNPWLAHSQAQEQAIDHSDRLIALTRSEGDLLTRYYPHARHKVRVVNNGIEDSVSARRAAFRRRDGRQTVVLYSGRLVERKGIRELIAAIADVLLVAPATSFVIVGGPPPLTGAEVAAQWLSTEHAWLAGRVHFTGWQSPENVFKWYRAADILVVPSRYEPFGMVILEAMLYGLAVLATAVGGPSEILEHGQTGLLFPARNILALSASLKWMIANPLERQRIARAGARRVRERWLWDQKVPAMVDVYQELICTKRQMVQS
jgi:glycosyltransferase involved in cell wall biosynthesis